jgi:hypothetical protein
MAKSPAERKAAQRARQAASGVRKLEIVLDAQEIEMLERNCATRRPGRSPYEFGEYIALLIRQDDARVRGRIKSISRKRCGKCGERVPVNSCPCNGDSPSRRFGVTPRKRRGYNDESIYGAATKCGALTG